MKGNGFLSVNALMKANIIETVGWMENSLSQHLNDTFEGTEKWAAEQAYNVYSHDGKLALISRAIEAKEPLEECVVIDAVDAIAQCEKNNVLEHMANDVRQWGEFQMPYPATLMKLDDKYVALIYRLKYDLNDKPMTGLPVWNVWLFTDVDNVAGPKVNNFGGYKHDPWIPCKAFFQIGGTGEGYGVSFDTAVEEDQKSKHQIVIMAARAFKQICALLFLLEHRKVQAMDARVPTRTNSKRIKTKRLPYNEYKVAVLGDYATPASKKEKGTGTHASPKMHFVVGHWHRFQKKTKLGKLRTWIHAYVKGDPSLGIITKEYRMMETEPEE